MTRSIRFSSGFTNMTSFKTLRCWRHVSAQYFDQVADRAEHGWSVSDRQ
jgi:hypothetical protein